MNQLGNTEIKILKIAIRRNKIDPWLLTDVIWPTSRQRCKKVATVTSYLRKLSDSGYVRLSTIGWASDWVITDAGRVAAKNASQRNRPVKMRIAK